MDACEAKPRRNDAGCTASNANPRAIWATDVRPSLSGGALNDPTRRGPIILLAAVEQDYEALVAAVGKRADHADARKKA